jgi:hypothetical protein
MFRCSPLQPEAFEGDLYHLDMMIYITFPRSASYMASPGTTQVHDTEHFSAHGSNKLGLKAWGSWPPFSCKKRSSL